MFAKKNCNLLVLKFISNIWRKYGKEKVYPAQDSGDVIIFPSFLTHGVEPVTSGIRRSIVTWLVGPFFK